MSGESVASNVIPVAAKGSSRGEVKSGRTPAKKILGASFCYLSPVAGAPCVTAKPVRRFQVSTSFPAGISWRVPVAAGALVVAAAVVVWLQHGPPAVAVLGEEPVVAAAVVVWLRHAPPVVAVVGERGVAAAGCERSPDAAERSSAAPRAPQASPLARVFPRVLRRRVLGCRYPTAACSR
jgi:hypothetical protein